VPASTFQRCAVASGLVTHDDVDRATAAVRAASSDSNQPVGDEQLAVQLIAMGRLNSWQVTQLRAGRKSFTLGPYRIIDSLGKGTMGDVYMAEHSVMGRIVAIKVLPKRQSSPAAIAQFTTEIRVQAQLDHKNLVRAYDAGAERNVHFLVMEYVPGTTLRRRVRRQGKLTMQMAAAFIAQAADGLAFAHRRGLTHRDVKPTNLLVTPEGQVKLSDMGLAGFFGEAPAPANTHRRSSARWADYLAPEQIAHPGTFSAAADVYALGCTLYYAVTGKVPFPAETAEEKTAGHLHALPMHPRLLNAELSDEFVDLIGEMMAKDPRERTSGADEVSRRLHELA
jgi:serine/threonine protein kinase